MNLGARADAGVDVSSNGKGGSMELFNLSTPAGWAMFWWGLSVLIILALMVSL